MSTAGASRVAGTGDLHAPIDSLSAAYMGAISWTDLRAVGRVTGSIDAAARADALFAHRPLTWSGTFF